MGGNVIPLGRGTTRIRQSGRLRPDHHAVPGSNARPALAIQGEDIDLDLEGSVLSGAEGEQDSFEGVGIQVQNARNVTIRNARVHGYRFNLHAEGCNGLRLINCDFSGSRAECLREGGEILDKWLEIRDLGFWRTTGAGMWLDRCHRVHISETQANGAQNGIVLVGCQACEIFHNDLSFNSGWGVAMWASSRNVVAWNNIDFVNRPWRGGWGGDSAAVLLVNESHQNYIVANSMTHSGDGAFLTDRTQGGLEASGASNENILAFNDGSFSTNNAFEATFSARNVFYRNYANDSRYGFWLGFSNESWVLENEICRNAEYGVAIEHGRSSQIAQNTMIANGRAAVRLWAPRREAKRSHPSTDIVLAHNAIRSCPLAVAVEDTTDLLFHENECLDAPWPDGVTSSKNVKRPEAEQARYDQDGWFLKVVGLLKRRPVDFHAYAGRTLPQGWGWISCGPFGPEDFRGRPVLWRRVGDRCVELFLTDTSMARYAIRAGKGVLMESPRPGVPFTACSQTPRKGVVTVRHLKEMLRIEL
ncbi:MAG: right-handed parallel beta-helix repeat-containing protein [Fimbriimonadaceae bacterium]|nr:right-handed parallel beta-helix repeat-containing protein [Chthonomonadaceae bacterium]MCO5295284.1 right-handed parallel beta-helix repeat-containing protein [Fimbriimonadaceae bacterium]